MPRELDEGPSDEDVERFGDATVACPSCGTELYDDVALCYKCGRALNADDDTKVPGKGALLIVILVILAITGAAAYLGHWF